jgi:hypothetical protein
MFALSGVSSYSIRYSNTSCRVGVSFLRMPTKYASFDSCLHDVSWDSAFKQVEVETVVLETGARPYKGKIECLDVLEALQ